jgi:predicted RNA binding protein YcfA (HicA-like mRNA interferase family)
MPRRKRITGKELIRALKKIGFAVIRIQGSHHRLRLRHPDGRVTTVPVHAGETVGPGLLGQILRDCDLTHEQLESPL